MFAGCLQIMWAHSHLIRVEGGGYSQIIRAENADVCRSYGLCLQAASAIILWNTVYLWRVVEHLRKQGVVIVLSDLAHISPLGWEHINLTGDYHWDAELSFGLNQFRPLHGQSC